MIFFESLDLAGAYARWSLKGMTAASVVSGFRQLYASLVDACGWHLEDELRSLRVELGRPKDGLYDGGISAAEAPGCS